MGGYEHKFVVPGPKRESHAPLEPKNHPEFESSKFLII